MTTPVSGTYPPYFANYIRLVEAESVPEAIRKYSQVVIEFFQDLPNEKTDYRYAAGKWSIKEMLQHIIDAERIFAYRVLRIARHDKTPLPGFDEATYAAAANATRREWQGLLDEFRAVRKSTDLLLESFTAEDLQQFGTTNDDNNTAVAIAFVVFGHILHHINIINDRYL